MVRGRERELTTRPRERQLVVGQETGSWWQESREAVGGRRAEVSGWTRERSLRLDRREANSRSWRGRTEGQSTPDTGTERRGDKIGSSEEEFQDV